MDWVEVVQFVAIVGLAYMIDGVRARSAEDVRRVERIEAALHDHAEEISDLALEVDSIDAPRKKALVADEGMRAGPLDLTY